MTEPFPSWTSIAEKLRRNAREVQPPPRTSATSTGAQYCLRSRRLPVVPQGAAFADRLCIRISGPHANPRCWYRGQLHGLARQQVGVNPTFAVRRINRQGI
jgi:hypothetical protein